jgi:hypothetical protein
MRTHNVRKFVTESIESLERLLLGLVSNLKSQTLFSKKMNCGKELSEHEEQQNGKRSDYTNAGG